MNARGEFNHSIVAVGSPGCGKSTWLVQRVINIARDTGCVVVGYDPGYRVPVSINGRTLPVARFDSVAAIHAALRVEARRVCLLAAGECGELVAYARRLSAASLSLHGGQRGVPVIVLLDESVLIEGADTYRLDPDMRALLTGRRHENIGLATTMQTAGIAHKTLLSLATEIACFRIADPVTIARLRACGIPQEALAGLPTAPKFNPYVFRES